MFFKGCWAERKELVRTFSAFANQQEEKQIASNRSAAILAAPKVLVFSIVR
jgi:hypothetical protein